MGYTTVADRSEAVEAAAALAAAAMPAPGAGAQFPRLLIDQLMAEAGVVEPRICSLALEQAGGDLARACSLVRAWGAVIPRLETAASATASLRALRRITPGFAEPRGGQFLGASLDYSPRLLDLGSRDGTTARPQSSEAETAGRADPMPAAFPRSVEGLLAEGLLASAEPPASADDLTRQAGSRTSRGALLQVLSRAETGAMTALAYALVRGYSAMQDPTLVELRSGQLPVRVRRPGGGLFTVGEVPVTFAEVTLYRLHGGEPDPRLTLGFGATPGTLERRAISAALLDASCARAAGDDPRLRQPGEDAEFLSTVLDGQEATGFVEHLKLPHHVTFTSELDRLRQARDGRIREAAAG